MKFKIAVVLVLACVVSGFSKAKPVKVEPFIFGKASYYSAKIALYPNNRAKRRAYYDSLVVYLEEYHKRIGRD